MFGYLNLLLFNIAVWTTIQIPLRLVIVYLTRLIQIQSINAWWIHLKQWRKSSIRIMSYVTNILNFLMWGSFIHYHALVILWWRAFKLIFFTLNWLELSVLLCALTCLIYRLLGFMSFLRALIFDCIAQSFGQWIASKSILLNWTLLKLDLWLRLISRTRNFSNWWLYWIF